MCWCWNPSGIYWDMFIAISDKWDEEEPDEDDFDEEEKLLLWLDLVSELSESFEFVFVDEVFVSSVSLDP